MKPNDVMPVPCPAWAEKLAAQPADLTAEERSALANHILTCPACASVQVAYRAMDASILALPPVAALAELPHIDGMETESQSTEDRHTAPASTLQPPPVPTGRQGRKNSRGWVRFASTMAAVLVVGTVIAGFLVVVGTHDTLISRQNSGSTLYVESVGADASEGGHGTVYAVHPSDGTVVWQKRLDSLLTGNLLVVKNTLFANSEYGRIYALRKSDGVLLWSSQITQGRTPLPASIRGQTATDGQNLYLSSRETLYAVDTRNGKVSWTRTSSGCSCTTSLLAATGGVVYVFMDGLYALRASDGKVLWHHPEILPAPIGPNGLIVTDGKVYVSLAQGSAVDVLRVSDGRLLHTLTFPSDKHVTYAIIEMAFADGVLYVNSDGHDLYAIRTNDDSTLWHKGFGDSGLYGLSAADNGTLYFAATTVIGSSISLVNTGQNVTPTPTISMSAPSSDIYALNASDGSLRWHLQPANNEGYASAVLAMGGDAYLSIGKHLYALAGKDGGQLWIALNAPTLSTPVAG